MSSVAEKLKSLPRKPGVYLFLDRNRQVIYVGKAKSIRKRVSSYFKKHSDIKTTILLGRLQDIDYVVAASELDALILEADLIKKYKPRYNISWRDDKAYPYLKLTVNEKWPRLFLVRRKHKDGALYFGPYEGGMIRSIIRLIKKMFPIRWCKETPLRMREQPCLFYRIGNCSGPCVGKTSHADYMEFVKGIIFLLRGKMKNARQKLEKEMKKASQNQDFEKAASLRDRLKRLEKMLEEKDLKHVPSPRVLTDVSELQKELRLKNPPMRIEEFDISNIQGTNIVGSMVVFFGGVPLNADYRRFKIRSFDKKPNDVAGIHEIVLRRYSKSLSKQLPLPDLILIDGGPAQLSAALKALREAGHKNMPVISLAKREEEIYRSGKNVPLRLKKRSPALQLLMRIRDEAHRFAITYHRQKRQKEAYR